MIEQSESNLVEDWEKQILRILSSEDNIKSNSKVTSLENADLRTQLFFGKMLKDKNITSSVNDHLKLNKSNDGWFGKLMRDVMRGKVEREQANTIEKVMQWFLK